MSFSRRVARVVGVGAVSLGTLATTPAVGELRLLQLIVVGRGETVDVVPNSKTGQPEIAATYRELKPGEPEAAAGTPYTVYYAWDAKASALVPVRVEGQRADFRKGVFGTAGCVHGERTITRMDFELLRHTNPLRISVDAPVLDSNGDAIPEQRVQAHGAGANSSFLLLEGISNLCFLDAAAVPLVPKRTPIATIAMEFYRGRAIAVVGTDQDWKTLPPADFDNRAEAESYLRKVRAAFGLDKP